MKVAHNRKWPLYTMPVGGTFTVDKPPRRLRRNLYRRAAAHGIVISIRRFNGQDEFSGFVCTRRA